jgi:hypothetical protein
MLNKNAETYIEAVNTAESPFTVGSAIQAASEHMYYVAMRITI